MENFQSYRSPGWYPDPDGNSAIERWWNGNEWSETRPISWQQDEYSAIEETAPEKVQGEPNLDTLPPPNQSFGQEQLPPAVVSLIAVPKTGYSEVQTHCHYCPSGIRSSGSCLHVEIIRQLVSKKLYTFT